MKRELEIDFDQLTAELAQIEKEKLPYMVLGLDGNLYSPNAAPWREKDGRGGRRMGAGRPSGRGGKRAGAGRPGTKKITRLYRALRRLMREIRN